jgi:hypothetical protein
MTPENKEILKKRSKSFVWRLGMMIVALLIDFALQNIGLVNLPSEVTTLLGLVLGEVSKQLNKKAALPANS